MVTAAAPMALHDLIDRGVVSRAEVIEGDVVLRPLRGRNLNLAVARPQGPSWFLKRSAPPPERDRLAQEVAAYRLLSGHGLAALAPRIAEDLSDDSLLVLELVPRSRSLADPAALTSQIDPGVGRSIGAALGALRAVPAPPGSPGTPWSFPVHAPDDVMLNGLSAANRACLSVVQDEGELPRLLAGFDATWGATCFMHGDVRFANVLVREGSGDGAQVTLVDWEFAGPGDPAWDVGCLLAEYADLWLASVPMLPNASEEELVALARVPLALLHPAIRGVWEGFVAAAPGSPDLLRCITAAGAALVQLAFAIGQDATSLGSSMLLRLQLAANILRDPEHAAAAIFGLHPARAVPV